MVQTGSVGRETVPAFAAAAAEFARRRAAYDEATLSREDMEQALRDLSVEHDGRRWMLGANSGRWYVRSASGWVEADPPTQAAPEVWEPHQVLRGHDGPIQSMAVDSESRTLATGGADGTLRLWDVYAGVGTAPMAIGGPLPFVAFTRDGAHIAYQAGRPAYVGLLSLDTGEQTGLLRDHAWGLGPLSAQAAVEGSLMATASEHAVHVWDLRARTEVARFPTRSTPVAVALSGNGSTVASGAADGTVELWDIATQAARPSLSASGPCRQIRFGARDDRLAVAGSGVDLFAPGRRTVRVTDDLTVALAWMRDGTGVVACGLTSVIIYRLGPGRADAVALSEVLPSSVSTVAVAPDGTWAATAHIDGSLRTWALPRW